MTEISEILSMVESRLNLGSEDAKKDNEEFRPPPDITDLATVLDTENSSKGKDFVFRKGTTSDVFEISDDAKQLGENSSSDTKNSHDDKNKKEIDEEFSKIYGNDSCNLDYTEEEFMKEFKDEEMDDEQNYENDPRQIAQYDIIERKDGVTMEESAGTISSMEAFNPKTKKLWYVVRIRLPSETDAKAIDFDLDDKKNIFIMFSHKYKSRGHFPGPIESQKYKATFQVDKHVLEVAVKAKD